MNEPNIVILAGGVSSRMRNTAGCAAPIESGLLREAAEKTKSMLSVGAGARPFMDYLLANILRASYRNVVIVVNERDDSIRRYYRDGAGASAFPGLTLSYALQRIPQGRTKPLGTADALLEALRTKPDWRGGSFTVCNSDNLYSVRSLSMLLECGYPNAMIDYDRSALRFEQQRIEQFSVMTKNADGFLLDIIEKPAPGDIARAGDRQGRVGVSMNIFRLSYDAVLPFLESAPLHPVRQEKELPVVVSTMAADPRHPVKTLPLAEHVIDLTAPSDIPEVQSYLRKEFPNWNNP
jgi:NDP-sugar pyrophosphorylase family protein